MPTAPDPIDVLYQHLVRAAESDDFDGYADRFDERGRRWCCG